MFDGLLTVTVFLPAAVAILVALFARGENADQQIRWVSIGATVVTFVLTVAVFVGYDSSVGGVQSIDSKDNCSRKDETMLPHIPIVARQACPSQLLARLEWIYGQMSALRA